jgi:hypothetical protein
VTRRSVGVAEQCAIANRRKTKLDEVQRQPVDGFPDVWMKAPGARRCTTRRPEAFTTNIHFMKRESCVTKGCFATFEASAARDDEVRHCNRGGPDGGHVNRWDGQSWQSAGVMQHDHSS